MPGIKIDGMDALAVKNVSSLMPVSATTLCMSHSCSYSLETFMPLPYAFGLRHWMIL